MKVLRNPVVLAIIAFLVIGVALSTLLQAAIPGLGMVTPKPSFTAETLFDLGPIHFTNSMLMTLIVIAAITFFFWWNTRNISLVPGRGQNFVEMIVEFLVNLVEGTAGKRTGRLIFPLVATLFIFIITSNYSGLLPGVGSIGNCEPEHAVAAEGTASEAPSTAPAEGTGTKKDPHLVICPEGKEFVPFFRSPDADLNTTLAMALITVVVVQVLSIRAHGVGGWLKEFATPAFLTPIHIIGEFSRIISLSARLFGNIFGGEVLLAVMYFLFGSIFAGAGVIIFLGLELLFGAIQALVFAFLTTVYISIAVAGHGDSHGHEEEHTVEGEGIADHPASGTEVHMA
jgi:F-type H+-transporting ATPase subunit a